MQRHRQAGPTRPATSEPDSTASEAAAQRPLRLVVALFVITAAVAAVILVAAGQAATAGSASKSGKAGPATVLAGAVDRTSQPTVPPSTAAATTVLTTTAPPVTAPTVTAAPATEPPATEPPPTAPRATQPPETAPPATEPSHGEQRTVNSTAYCGGGTTASGEAAYDGGAAMNGVPLGSRWRVLETGAVYTVNDRIGSGSDFDIYFSSCGSANAYGRRTVTIEQAA